MSCMMSADLTPVLFPVSVEAVGGKALACVVDIRDEQQIREAVQKAVDKFGGRSCLKQT